MGDVDNVLFASISSSARLVFVFLTAFFCLWAFAHQIQHESTTPSTMDDNDPPHIISQEDTQTMSRSHEDALRSAVLSALSSSASPMPSGLPSSGSASSSGFSSETPKISTGSSSAGSTRAADAEDVKALRDANASTTHLVGHVISQSDPASQQDIEQHETDTSASTPNPPNSLLDIMKRRYPDSSAAAAPVPNAAMRIRSSKRRGQESLAVKAVAEDATMTDPDQGSTPDLQSELVPNLSPAAQNSHQNCCTTKDSKNSQPTVQFSFLDSGTMPAENITSSSTGNVLQRACQMLQGYCANSSNLRTGNKYSSSSSQPPSQPQSPAKIRPTKSIFSAAAKTKRGGRRPDKNHQQGRQGKRLSLSEYRKADESSTVRLTDAHPHRSIHADYDLTDSPHCRILGHGASSTVRLAVRRSDSTLVAVKCLSKYDIMSSRRAGGRESTKSSPIRQRHRYSIGAGSSSSRRHRRLDECEVLRALDGVPNVTHLLDVYEDNDEVQLVLEYCPGGELFDAIQRRTQLAAQEKGTNRSGKSPGSGYTENEAATIIGQLLEALAALHERGIVHRDVKPENVFLMSIPAGNDNNKMEGTQVGTSNNNLEVRLSDFGLARYLHRPHHPNRQDADDASASSSASGGESPITPQSVLRARGRAYSSVGSDFYAAPEVENGSGYDTQCDVYSLGVTLYILLGGFPPRQRAYSLDAYDTMQSILDSPVSSSEEESSSDEGEEAYNANVIPVTFPGSHWKNVSSEAKDLVRRMMHNDPNVRVTAKDALQHAWIAQHFKTATTSATAKEQPSRAPRQKKRSSLVLTSTSDISAESGDRPNFRRKLSKLDLCDMSNEGTPDVSTQSSPVPNNASISAAATMPPPMSFDKAAFSMAELYNRMSLVADAAAAAEQVADGDDEEIIEDEGIDGDSNPTPECAVTTTVPLSV